MTVLVLLRHGQSQWNMENRFTGWVDVDLTERGENEARKAGELLDAAGCAFEQCFTSVQTRAIRTLWLALGVMGEVWLPVTKDYRLNERHYGALSGLNKAETAQKHGADQVHIWRRSYDVPPPDMAWDNPLNPCLDRRYAHIARENLPSAESLKDTLERVLPYWKSAIEPLLLDGENILISAHGNSLRALVKHIFTVADEAIVNVEIPTGNPLIIEFAQGSTNVINARYLDAERASRLPTAR
jgi:2,3-bisphosphoglycerate-dependent phosphoglycerate mutase